MAPLRRALWFVSCFAAVGCFGGPTSDWPKGADSEDDDEKPSAPANADGGTAGSAVDAAAARDAGKSTIDAEDSAPTVCTPDGGLPDAEVGDGSAPFRELVDGGMPDGEAADAGAPDSEAVDGASPDADAADGGVSDAEVSEGAADAGTGCE